MPNPLVECIPNFSEARRPEVVEAILQAISSVPGVQILDRHSDLDHNRTVITFVGAPQAVEEAAFRGIQRAADLIDLEFHRGEHPRIGATDVVPFVPIADLDMAECVEIARRLGQRVGQELGIPVYLYEEAATRPDRQNLENIRHGQYEALKTEIVSNPDRQPDYGPSKLTGAGATVIGARQPLIAYNVYLTTNEVAIAQKIARAVRNSSGGLRYIKALGMLVEGRAQVSMNLTNFRQTPVARVVEMIRREATRYGVGIHHTELVGLIPQSALVDAAQWYLQLDEFQPEQVLEQRLYGVTLDRAVAAGGGQAAPAPTPDFLDQLAAGSATPGGGAAAAHAGAMAAALVSMVARLTVGKKKYADVEARMQAIIERAETLRSELTAAVDQDSAAFDALMQAFKLPKSTTEEIAAREQAVEAATRHASEVPLSVARAAVDVLELAAQVAEAGNANALCDAGTGAALAVACFQGASLNVNTNIQTMKDEEFVRDARASLHELLARAAGYEESIHHALQARAGLTIPVAP
jgi:glutamate formiminotransferase/formiminotetrahydrofolate cyclodeaminase